MTLDQIWFRLCDKEVLKQKKGKRTSKAEPLNLVSKAAADGKITGRDAQGNIIRGVVRGKSKARELMERQQQREREARAAMESNRKRKKR